MEQDISEGLKWKCASPVVILQNKSELSKIAKKVTFLVV